MIKGLTKVVIGWRCGCGWLVDRIFIRMSFVVKLEMLRMGDR